MKIKLSMEILQVAVTIDEARQNGLASDINHLSTGRNRDFSTAADCLEPASLDNECFFCHEFFPPRPARRQHQSALRFDFHVPAANLFVGPGVPDDVAC